MSTATWQEDVARDLPPILSVPEVCQLLGVSKRTLERWRAAGRLKAFRLTPGGSGGVRVTRSEVIRLLTEAESA